MIKRALSLSERATQIVTPSTAVGVALAHAGVLEIGGMLEQCENVYIKAVMEHTGSLPCLSAYTRFLKQYGSVQLAETLEQEVGTRKSGAPTVLIYLFFFQVPALRKSSAPAALPSPRVSSERQKELLALRDKREPRFSLPTSTSGNSLVVPPAAGSASTSSPGKLGSAPGKKQSAREALKAVSGAKHQGLGDFKK